MAQRRFPPDARLYRWVLGFASWAAGVCRDRRLSALVPAERLAQFPFGPFQDADLALGKALAGPVDIEVEHRHGGLVGRGLAAPAALGRPLQGQGDPVRIARLEDRFLEVERVAALVHLRRPAAA